MKNPDLSAKVPLQQCLSEIRPKIKKLRVSGYPTVPNFLPPTLKFLSIFRGFPRDFPGRPSCFPIFPM